MLKNISPYDTYQVFYTINFDNTSIANKLKNSNGISISNILRLEKEYLFLII